MNAVVDAPTPRRPAGRRPDWRHGVRLALSVVVAFTASSPLQLPEKFRAVMSALIVGRPTAGSALGAGWDRVHGTLAGTVVGLAGVWLHHVGLGSQATTLAIVAVVAFASAMVPALRAAPISALIVLTSGGLPGHSALDVAGLRAIKIAIGVATGVLVSLLAFATHARTRFEAGCADGLRVAARSPVRDDLATAVREALAASADLVDDAPTGTLAALRAWSTPAAPAPWPAAPCRLLLQDMVQWRRTFAADRTKRKETA